MATPPDFTTGAVLTAAQMSAVGLWLVKSQTVGTGVSSVTVTGAFSADYDRYKIIYQGGYCSASGDFMLMSFSGITSSTAYSALTYQSATSYSLVTTGNAAVIPWRIGITGNTSNSQYNIELTSPLAANWKVGESTFTAGDNANSYGGNAKLWNTSGSSATGFTLNPGTGTMTGGTIRVYGYRN
jgi:hypothetical protein